MNISIREIGSTMLELTIELNGSRLIEEITKLDGTVDQGFINQLREVADELEEHNNQINKND